MKYIFSYLEVSFFEQRNKLFFLYTDNRAEKELAFLYKRKLFRINLVCVEKESEQKSLKRKFEQEIGKLGKLLLIFQHPKNVKTLHKQKFML
jgi:hypothetical protein